MKSTPPRTYEVSAPPRQTMDEYFADLDRETANEEGLATYMSGGYRNKKDRKNK